MKEQLTRTPTDPPTVELNTKIQNIDDFTSGDINLLGYEPQGCIKAPVAV